MIKSGKFIDAWKMIYQEMPFPAICGRICAHPCQTACNRAKVDEPIQIATLKRLAADTAYQQDINQLPLPEKEADRQEKVAVIGSGPAGLSAAHFLALKGYKVTIFEALPVTGGMMRVGIPEYRLPKKWVDFEIDLIQRLGVEIKVNTALGKDITIDGLFKDGYKAIFLGVGCQKGTSMRTPGEDMEGVISAVDMLRRIGLGEKVDVGKKVLVVGGGNVAMDAARSARRAGAEVHVLYRRTRGEMPAAPEEVEEAIEEGVRFHFKTLIKEIKGKKGRITGISSIEVVRMEKDAKGKAVPVYGDAITEWTNVDTIISAIGQAADLSFVGDKPLANEWGSRIVADPETLATNVPGIFTGGDVFTGPALLIDAVGAGKRAAESIHRYIQGEDMKAGREFAIPKEKISPIPRKAESYPVTPKVKQSHAPAERRATNTEEVCLGFTPEQAQAEAERCLNCAICSECMQCVDACLPKAIDHSMQDKELEIEVGAMVMNPGFKPYDPEDLKLYGYGTLPNVVTSIQFERILSASGPYAGHMVRPSDHKEPTKIAWIQCVGSRNERIGKGYCSSVCCMYAIKQAVIAKEHSHDPLEAKLFYMDMRTPGKDFERYLTRAKDEQGIKFVRSRIFGVDPAKDGSDDIFMRYADEDGTIYEETFDMVVLSIGLSAPEGAKELGEAANIQLDKYGFCRADEYAPGCSSRPGIFVSGAFGEPKDIPETAVDASAAAAMVSRLLAPARGTMTTVQEFPPEKDVNNKLPRVGVFVCNCGINIGSVVKVPEVAEFAKTTGCSSYGGIPIQLLPR
ncbi:hypothetical protein N752_09500 [Desulforamulus aquiferis]|nr:hypothetical protein N752_09500 [Desulforamulus aquiferis]